MCGELPVDAMLDVLDRSVASLPERARPEARRGILAFYAALYANVGLPPPAWVQAGQDREAEAT